MGKRIDRRNAPRHQAAALLAEQFLWDYEDIIPTYELEQKIELTENLISTLQMIKDYSEKKDEAFYERFREKEDKLLKKYGKALKPYTDKAFHKYFYFETVLADKDFYSSEEYNKLTYEQQILSESEISQFLQLASNGLKNSLHFLLLEREPEFTRADETEELGEVEKDREFTKARQLLTIYFLLKTGFGIQHKSTHNTSDVARLIHLMTGTKFITLQKSDIYKKYKDMPDYNQGEQKLKDLQFIKPYFASLGIEKAVQLIDEEIKRTFDSLSFTLKKKYRDQIK